MSAQQAGPALTGAAGLHSPPQQGPTGPVVRRAASAIGMRAARPQSPSWPRPKSLSDTPSPLSISLLSVYQPGSGGIKR